jgi:hypothetical protein
MQNFERTLQISVENLQSFGRLYFTPRQLFYEVCRQAHTPIGLGKKTALSLFGISTVPTILLGKNKLGLLAASGLAFGTLAAIRQMPYTLPTPFSFAKFENFLAFYLQKHEIAGLLRNEKEIKFVENFPSDLELYGLPRTLICEGDEIAQMLRANQFHLQTPCAVLSLREAKPLSKSYKKMLNKAEEPQVFFLHNASIEAFSILQNLRETLELDEKIPLRPLGLRPVHARRLHLFTEKKSFEEIDLSIFDFLSETEKNWLSRGNSAEVSAVAPVRLLRVLRRLILGLEITPSEWQISLPKKNLGFM